tara:strand:- start:135 stop:371 length:237 start_codon:yes stop_codon:yes gene_type:complete
MRNKFLGVSFMAFALFGTMLFNPQVSVAFEGGDCTNEDEATIHGNQVHLLNWKNKFWSDGCSKECDSICELIIPPDPE